MTSAAAAGETTGHLSVGRADNEWIAGFHFEDVERRSISFFGYEEVVRAGGLHIQMDSQQVHGWGSTAKTAILGNLRYSILGYMGRDGFPGQRRLALDDDFRMGVAGDVLLRSGVFGRGLEFDVSVWRQGAFRVMPFLKSFSPHNIRWGIGYDSSHAAFSRLGFEHRVTSDSMLNGSITVYTDINDPLDAELVWSIGEDDFDVLQIGVNRTDQWRVFVTSRVGKDWRYEARWTSEGVVKFMAAYRFF